MRENMYCAKISTFTIADIPRGSSKEHQFNIGECMLTHVDFFINAIELIIENANFICTLYWFLTFHLLTAGIELYNPFLLHFEVSV